MRVSSHSNIQGNSMLCIYIHHNMVYRLGKHIFQSDHQKSTHQGIQYIQDQLQMVCLKDMQHIYFELEHRLKIQDSYHKCQFLHSRIEAISKIYIFHRLFHEVEPLGRYIFFDQSCNNVLRHNKSVHTFFPNRNKQGFLHRQYILGFRCCRQEFLQGKIHIQMSHQSRMEYQVGILHSCFLF